MDFAGVAGIAVATALRKGERVKIQGVAAAYLQIVSDPEEFFLRQLDEIEDRDYY